MSPRERTLVHALRVAIDALEAHLEARSNTRPRVVYSPSNDGAVPTELDRALARGILARVGGRTMKLELSSPAPDHQAKRQRVGAEAERRFAALLEASERAGLGVLRKRHASVIVRAGRARYTGTSGCDFSGHLRGGRAAYIELKHTDAPRLSLDMLRPSQRAELARAHADGALAAIAVFVGPLARAWLSVLPWPVVAGHIEAGDASVPCAALEAWRVPATVPVLAARWTEASTWAR